MACIAVFGIYVARRQFETGVKKFKAEGFRNTDISVLVMERIAAIEAISIPGIDPFMGAAPISGMPGGVGEGGIGDALIQMRIPPRDAKRYKNRILRGSTFVFVHVDGALGRDKAKRILDETGAQDVDSVSNARDDLAASGPTDRWRHI